MSQLPKVMAKYGTVIIFLTLTYFSIEFHVLKLKSISLPSLSPRRSLRPPKVGHQRPVLSVTATKSCLFSASKDGTAKLWDLEQLVEVCSLTDHPDAVNVIRYDEANKQIFTCSKSQIKIWDPRQNPINCVRTLW